MKKLFVILMVLAAANAFAQAPRTMNFQGTLADGGGVTLPDGNYNITFRLWNSDVGGVQLWTETISVSLSSGIFNTILGETTPLLLPFDDQYWLGIAVGADPELSPRAPLTGMPYAMDVVEGAVVQSLNGRVDHLSVVGGANIQVQVVGNDIIINGTGALTDGDWDVVGNDMTSIPVGNVGIGEPAPTSKLHVGGDITLGDAVTPNWLFANNGFGFTARFGGDYLGEGSEMELMEETGIPYAIFEPDFNGSGAFVLLYNGNYGTAFEVDGSYNNNSPRITSSGNNGSVVFDLEQLGDTAVRLPTSSLSASEILDEPGVASISAHGTSSFAVTTSVTAVTARSITVPADGFILAVSSFELELNHEAPGASYMTAGLSLTAGTVDSNQDLSYYLPATAGLGQYLMPSSATNVYPVTAGTHTVYLNAYRTGTSDAVIWDVQLNLVYIPTAYGTVTTSLGTDPVAQADNGNVSPKLTAGDIAAERDRSIGDNDDRVARELAAMRAEIDALKQEMANRNGTAVNR